MKRITLNPDVPKRVPVSSGKWLVVRESEDYLYLASDNEERVRIEAGDRLFVGDLSVVELINPHVTDIDVLYQVVARDISVQATQLTKIAEAIDVSEVRSVVSTREVIAATFDTPDHITIPVAQSVRLAVGSATRKEIIIQNISTTETEIMVGDSLVASNRGLPVLGSRANVGGLVLTGKDELWVYNNSSEVATVAVLEVRE